MTAKRIFDIVFALTALAVTMPFLAVVAVWIRFDSCGPIIYRQERIGLHGEPFEILKFRTMSESPSGGEQLITRTGDSRVTRAGRFLRKTKIDELPQFVNVLRGQMSVVGPRPEVAKYVALYPEAARQKILSVKPGITDRASILLRDEGDLLAATDDPENEYVTVIMPRKIRLYEDYVDNWSIPGDLRLILQTISSVIWRF